jgi:hypothetical protein
VFPLDFRKPRACSSGIGDGDGGDGGDGDGGQRSISLARGDRASSGPAVPVVVVFLVAA